MGKLDWKALVRQAAPTLGAALGGPLAGAATKVIAEKILGTTDTGDATLEMALASATPEQLAKLKEAEYDFKIKMQQAGIDVFGLEVQDRASARALFAINSWPQILITGTFIWGYFMFLGTLMWMMNYNAEELSKIGESGQWYVGMFLTVIGVLTSSLPQILQFWFGGKNRQENSTTTGDIVTK